MGRRGAGAGVPAAALVIGLAAAGAAPAEVVVHGAGTPLTGAITITGDSGTVVGTAAANLFHSFSVFNVNLGESVTFTAPSDGAIQVRNVINRVTGAGASSINGLIQSSIPGADHYFFNPNGIGIGPSARINVAGSFYFSTANALHLADGGVFFADPSASSVLTAAAPASFGFGAAPAPITVTGGFFGALGIPPGETFGLVGGNVTLDQRAIVAAPRSRIDIVSVASAGHVPIGPAPDLSSFPAVGDVTLRGESLVDGQEVYIRGGRLVIEDASISPGALSLVFPGGFPGPDGGGVDVEVRGELRVTSTKQPQPGLNFGSPNVVPSGIYAFSDFSNGDVPTVDIRAGSVLLSGRGGTAPGAPFAGIVTERFGAGGSGGMTVEADRIEVRSGAELSSVNYRGSGPGADLALTADTILLSRDGAANFTGIGVQSKDAIGPAGFSLVTHAGRLTIDADTLEIRTGAEISNESFTLGRAGDITIRADRLIGTRDGATTGGITSQSAIAGDAGTLTLDVGTLELDGGFQVSNSVAGTGDAGGLSVNASEHITLQGENTGLFSTARDTRPEDIDLLASFLGVSGDFLLGFFGGLDNMLAAAGIANTPGTGGVITVNAPSLAMSGDSRIDSSTFGDGPAGAIHANVTTVDVRDSALIRSQSGGIERDTGQLVVGAGAGGLVSVSARDVTLSGTANGKRAGLSASTRGTGRGGDVVVDTATLTLRDGAAITSESLGTEADLAAAPAGSGEAGDIRITASDRVVMHDALISTESKISGGGDIVMRIRELLHMQSSTISTSAGSALTAAPGDVQALFLGGGNIDIDPEFVVLNDSLIQANAFAGDGGNITIVAGQFLIANSVIEARSTLRQDGEIRVEAPDSDISSSLVELPRGFLDVASLLKDLCDSRRAGGLGNSLVVRGPGGLPASPDGYVAADVTAAGAASALGLDDVDSGPALAEALALVWTLPACGS